MLSLHAVRSIKATVSDGGNWVELTFESRYSESTTTITIYTGTGSPEGDSAFAKAIAEAINNIPLYQSLCDSRDAKQVEPAS